MTTIISQKSVTQNLGGQDFDATEYVIEILVDAVERQHETYKAVTIPAWYQNGEDYWHVLTSVDREDGTQHWRYLSDRRQHRRISSVVYAIKQALKREAAQCRLKGRS